MQYTYSYSSVVFLTCFVCMSCSFISSCKWRVNQPITSPLHLILILYLEYIHWSFPIKPPIDIAPKSISEILFCLFISPLCHKRQVPLSFYFSSLTEGLHLLTKLHPPIVQLLFCFTSVCTTNWTKDCKFFVNVSFFALLINLLL